MFFEYFIQKLRKQHKIFATSRKYQQVNDIVKFGSINPILIGKHGGGKKSNKILASLQRSKRLKKKIDKLSPDLLISFCSPEASRVAYESNIPHIAFSDSPHAKAVMKLSLPFVTNLLTPLVIPINDFTGYGIDSKNIIKNKMIDAALIIKNYKNIKKKNSKSKKIILIRPEEVEAAYASKNSKTVKIIKKIVEKFPNEEKVVLSRYENQSKELKRVFGSKISLFSKPINGQEFLRKTDCFVGSGGTMTAESGLLGIPTISLKSIPNKIEDYLVKKKLIVRADTTDKISKEVFRALNDDDFMKKRKIRAKKIIRSFEDPYQILVKTIRTL